MGVVIAALFTYGQTNPDFLYLLSNGLPPFVALAAATIAVVALVKNGVRRGDRLAAVWLGYTSGMLLWFSGELIWAVYSLGWGFRSRILRLRMVSGWLGTCPLRGRCFYKRGPFVRRSRQGTWLSGWSRLSCRRSWRKSKKL